MKTGIVFQIEGRKATVLTANGTFVFVRAQSGWTVGETVSIAASSKHRVKPLLAMAACLVMVVFGGFGWNHLYTTPVSLISLDVNPSIELGVNRWNRIIYATARNEAGLQILTETRTKNAVCQDALSNILNAEGAHGYLTSRANVVLTVFSTDATVQSSLLAELQGVVNTQLLGYSEQITAEYHAVDAHTVSGAHGHGVTAGKYLYLQELQTLVPEVDFAQYTHHSIEQIKGEIAVCRQSHGEIRGGAHHGEAHHGKGHWN